MNWLIVLASLCALLIGVQCENEGPGEPPICRLIGGDEEKLSTLTECINTNFPQIVVDIIAQCHEQVYGEAGNTKEFLKKLCGENQDSEALGAMEKCMDEEGEKVENIEEEEIEQSAAKSELCFLNKFNAVDILTINDTDEEEVEID